MYKTNGTRRVITCRKMSATIKSLKSHANLTTSIRTTATRKQNTIYTTRNKQTLIKYRSCSDGRFSENKWNKTIAIARLLKL